jgi:thiol-disulfide isomerase/thioredoxin
MRKLVVLALLLLCACQGGKATPRTGPPECKAKGLVSPGQAIPLECRFSRPEGGELALADLKGVPAIINFWASWCTNCIDEMPDLERAHGRLGDRVRIVGANLLGVQGETRSAARAFAKKTGITYEVIYDEGGLLYAHFSARLLPPTTIFVDAQGIVRYRHFGPLDDDKILQLSRRHLGIA